MGGYRMFCTDVLFLVIIVLPNVNSATSRGYIIISALDFSGCRQCAEGSSLRSSEKMTTHEYWRESDSMTLSQFTEYYKRYYPQAFIIESQVAIAGHGLQQGQIGIACHQRKVRVLQATRLFNDGGTLSVTIPINLALQFALLPAENCDKFWGCENLSVNDIVHPNDRCVPKAVQVMKTCTNSKGQEVLANVVLFNVTLSSKRFGKRGFTGTSANGVRHTFHIGDATAQFSSRLGDNKSFPADFFDHITFPQKARVYFSPGKECQVEGLDHLCIVEFTGHHEQDFIDIKSNVDDPDSHDYQSIPLGLDIVMSAVTLKDYPMDKLALKDRKMIKHLSAENIVQRTGNLYVSQPINPAIRDEPDPIPQRQPTPPDSRRQSQISVSRSQSTYDVGRRQSQIHVAINYCNWPPEQTEDASHPQSRRESQSSIKFSVDTEYYNWPPPEEVVYQAPIRRGSKIEVTLYPPGYANSAEVLTTCVESPGEYSYADNNPTQGQSRTDPSPSPQHTKLKQSTPLPPQSPPVLPRPQNPERHYEETDEEVNTVEDKPSKKPARVWRSSKSRTTKPSSQQEHSPRHGLPSTAIRVLPTDGPPPSPPVHKKPITQTSRPKEPELRYHVAAKLGQDWRRVGTYLGLQYWQLDQASAAHSQLEEKAMEALVMWLRGQGDSNKPRSWKTVLDALRLAGQKDMAAKLERDIREGKLQVHPHKD